MKLPTVEIESVDHIAAGNHIRRLRNQAGMSLRKLAMEMGVSAPFVSDLERGNRSWSEENFAKAQRLIAKHKNP